MFWYIRTLTLCHNNMHRNVLKKSAVTFITFLMWNLNIQLILNPISNRINLLHDKIILVLYLTIQEVSGSCYLWAFQSVQLCTCSLHQIPPSPCFVEKKNISSDFPFSSRLGPPERTARRRKSDDDKYASGVESSRNAHT